MKLAEALNERANLQTRLAQLKTRADNAVRIQEGDTPAEDPQALIDEAERVISRLAYLIARINLTNSTTEFDGQRSIADAIVDRDMALRRNKFYTDLADTASTRMDRYTRAEVRFVAAYPVEKLREAADKAGQEFRQIDVKLQELNWLTELK